MRIWEFADKYRVPLTLGGVVSLDSPGSPLKVRGVVIGANSEVTNKSLGPLAPREDYVFIMGADPSWNSSAHIYRVRPRQLTYYGSAGNILWEPETAEETAERETTHDEDNSNGREAESSCREEGQGGQD